ncbi:uncharacterized protein [Asterias amurensis]|uniref:uncharacterized protein n=1 Tax=Asterias amurensis TaxID=7602 RepID=UPI003AB43ACF
MEARTKPDMNFKANGLMFVTFSLAVVYIFIAFSTARKKATCVETLSWKSDAYKVDTNLRIEATYNQFQPTKTDNGVMINQLALGSPAGHDASTRLSPGDGDGGSSPEPYQCTASDLQRRSGTILLTTTNSAYLDFTENWLESIRRTRACPNISVVTEDDQAFNNLSNKTMAGLNVLKTQTAKSTTGKLVFNTKEYKKFVNKRQGYILDLLEQGWEVLFSDVDTFWLRDPFLFFQGNFDMALEEDNHNPASYCAGFVYFRPTERTMQFVKEWIRFMANDKTMKPDQVVMNIMIRRKVIAGLKLRVLDSNKFPNGKLFFDDEWRKDKKDFVVVHNNWIVGHDPKVERFQNCSMWLVDHKEFKST